MVKFIIIDEDTAGQRIDNYLITHLKGVPKSRIYRGLRKGEFRVNSGRISAEYRLCTDDRIRVPPLRVADRSEKGAAPSRLLRLVESRILYEDDGLLVVNKPSGIPVHGGTGVSWGLIELLRHSREQPKPLELIHRLDRETSGCLLVAKKRSVLLEWHDLLARRQVKKQYTLLVRGRWDPRLKVVDLPLKKNVLRSGERMVCVDSEGKPSRTCFRILQQFEKTTLLSAELITGRTHQIRVHAAASGYPIVGDSKYGEKSDHRLFLHATSIRRRHKTEAGFQGISAPLDADLEPGDSLIPRS